MAVRERPILMSAPMVRAILDGHKTQTRRIVKRFTPCGGTILTVCPYGNPGDRLWVKEAWRLGGAQDRRSPKDAWNHVSNTGQGLTVLYEAGGWKENSPSERKNLVYPENKPMPEWAGRKRSSMFMPLWASRITLEITEVRVQRLQDISDKDCFAEGIQHVVNEGQKDDGSARGAYKALWESINGLGSWILNPWVFAISFRRI